MRERLVRSTVPVGGGRSPFSFGGVRGIVKITFSTLALALSVLFMGGYFFVVHQRLRNPFISWPMLRPAPMEAYYTPTCLRVLYEPVVRLDQKLCPKRWQCPPTPIELYPTNSISIQQFYKDLLRAQAADARRNDTDTSPPPK
jgi:hypothetical protein